MRLNRRSGAALLLSCSAMLGLAAPLLRAQEPANPTVYEVTVDGRKIEATESQPVKARLADGREVSITVSKKRLQPYAMGPLKFTYDATLSLKDDLAQVQRQVILMHANGASIVITDLGKPANDPRANLQEIATAMRQRFSRGNIKDLKETPAETVRLKGTSGLKAVLTYMNEDGKPQVCELYALSSGGRSFYFIRQYRQAISADAQQVTDPTLNSIVAE